MPLSFEWDPRKDASNRRKHRVPFSEAASAFADPLSVTKPDPDHSVSENRFILLGLSIRGRLLVVSHAERGDNIRIISARLATNREREAYEED